MLPVFTTMYVGRECLLQAGEIWRVSVLAEDQKVAVFAAYLVFSAFGGVQSPSSIFQLGK
ncbi:hypothetical protein Pan181_48470 [Aeoliella mucimassa]|uniref:Uncharacterized protein n=1 Tax=Aeoliella mucimassa TaxID=2527972 RepID=A0A518AV66_9BACT|nr:hypothetical protein Pan181_48470 [Aeoliella mucimassa]